MVNAGGGALIDGNAVINANLHSISLYTGGIAANAENGATITNNLVHGTFTGHRYPAAVVGYGRFDVIIQNNLVDANLVALLALLVMGAVVSARAYRDHSHDR